MEDVGIFNGHLVNFPAIWHILWPFGIFYPDWYIYRFGMLYQEKSGNPAVTGGPEKLGRRFHHFYISRKFYF
jgi:hypothetical protein